MKRIAEALVVAILLVMISVGFYRSCKIVEEVIIEDIAENDESTVTGYEVRSSTGMVGSYNVFIGGIRVIRKSCFHDEILGIRMILKHSEGKEFILCSKCYNEYVQAEEKISKQLMEVLEQLTSEDEGEKLVSPYWREG